MTSGKLKPGWTAVAFGDVVKLNKDRSKDPAADGIDRYVGLEHIEPENLRIRKWGSVSNGTTFTQRFKPGHVLFGKRRAYQRKVAVADFEGICSGDIYVFEPKNNKLIPELLPFICQTEAFYNFAVGTSAGSLSPRTNWKHLAEFEFALPPLDEQRRIAEVLWAAENLRRKAETAHAKSWKTRLAMYKELTQTSGVNSKQKKTSSGLIPAHWELSTIGESLLIANRFRKPINKVERSKIQGEYPYYGPTGQLDSLNEYRIDGTYVLIGEDGDHFLKHRIWSMTQLISGRFNVNNHAHILQGTDRCLTEWFYHFFRHRDIYQWLTKQGSGRLKLKKADLEQMIILLPPIEEQKHVINRLDAISRGTEEQERYIQRSATILSSLRDQSINIGELS